MNREVLWQLLRIYDVGGKVLNGIKSMYINSIACVRIKGMRLIVLGSIYIWML